MAANSQSPAAPLHLPDEPKPGAVAVLPFVYLAWADGVLTPSETEAIRDRLEQQPWLDEDGRAFLRHWLNPAASPTATELADLLGLIRRLAARTHGEDRASLADLGVELALAEATGDGDFQDDHAHGALCELESALGLVGHEACRELLGTRQPVAGLALEEADPAFDVDRLIEFLDGPYRSTRERLRQLLDHEGFRVPVGPSRKDYRTLVLGWCRELGERGFGALGFPTSHGGTGDMGEFLATADVLGAHDLSLFTKVGVQYGLFAGSIFQLGTEQHHQRWLTPAARGELLGCFAMSELGHGSNVREIETTARYDAAAEEFVIHTPLETARKEWIGNAAEDGRMATVFAQLAVDGRALGVHAFVVPLRDGAGQPLPGVRLEDNGLKIGLRGVDNGRIWFDQVRIPRENLLDRFASVSADGTYESPIASASKRFFTMLGTLVGGRLAVARAALGATRAGLAIAVRYGASRRQFGPAGAPEMRILDYLTHQRRLMPALATAYGLGLALDHAVSRYLEPSDDHRELEGLVAGLKAYSSWHAMRTLQACRECCGGQGYLEENQLGRLRADSDVLTTYEGDNTVLLQLVAKGLLTGFRQQFAEHKLFSMLRFVAKRAATSVLELNPVTIRRTDEDHLRDPDFQLAALRYREEEMVASAAQRLKQRIDAGTDSFLAVVECQDDLVELSLAYVERVIAEQMEEAVGRTDDPALESTLTALRDLFVLSRLERDRGWFLEAGYLASVKSRAISSLVNQLVGEVREQAVHLIRAFGLPQGSITAPIAAGASNGEAP